MAMLSIVIPIHNEEPSILPLYDRLTAVLEQLQRPYEILFVDDASTDRSFELLANLVETDGHLKSSACVAISGKRRLSRPAFTNPKATSSSPWTAINSTRPRISPRCSKRSTRDTISPAAGASIAWTMPSCAGSRRASPIG